MGVQEEGGAAGAGAAAVPAADERVWAGGGRDVAGGARAGAVPSLPAGFALFMSRPTRPRAACPARVASQPQRPRPPQRPRGRARRRAPAAPPAPEGRSRARGRSSTAASPRALSGRSGFLGAVPVPGRPRQRRREGLGVARRPSPAIGAWRCGAAPERPDAPRPCAAPQVPERAESGRAGGGAVWGSR